LSDVEDFKEEQTVWGSTHWTTACSTMNQTQWICWLLETKQTCESINNQIMLERNTTTNPLILQEVGLHHQHQHQVFMHPTYRQQNRSDCNGMLSCVKMCSEEKKKKKAKKTMELQSVGAAGGAKSGK
jgi:hypothetical protein